MNQCPNCATPLEAANHFCSQCGQRTHQHRFNLPHILHEFFHAFTHADKGLLMLVRDLALRPGQVLREYIVEFKRVRYFNPFTFLLLVLGFTVFVNSVVKPYTLLPTLRTASVSVEIDRNGAGTAPLSAVVARRQRVGEWLEKRTNWVTLASIPITALVFWLFYRRLHYAEHLVAQIVLAGFYMLAGAMLMLLALVPALHLFATGTGQLIIHGGYLAWAYGQFTGGSIPTPSHFLRAGLASICALLLWSVCSAGLIFLYIAFG